MGDSHFVSGGHHAPPQAWVERLSAVGVQIELPPDDLRPASGGDFSVRLEHPVARQLEGDLPTNRDDGEAPLAARLFT